MCCERKLKKKKKTGGFSDTRALTDDIPVKNSPNSCSSFMALSNVFLACSSVSLLFMSLCTGETRKDACTVYLPAEEPRLAYTNTQHLIARNTKPARRVQHVHAVKEYSHQGINGFGFDKDGDGIQLCYLEAFNGISRHIQNAVFALRHMKTPSFK